MGTKRPVSATFEPGSRLEGPAAMLPFLLGALLTLLNLLDALHVGTPTWVSSGALAAVLIPFVIGLVKGLPRWSLPYGGVIGLNVGRILTHRGTFMGLNTRAGVLGPLLGWLDRLLLGVLGPSTPWFIRAAFGAGLDWVALLGLTACGLLIVAPWRPLRPLYSRIREDWMQLSFGLYGATMLAVFYTFKDYPIAKYPFMSASLLILAAGAWFYVRNGRPSRRAVPSRQALALVGAMVLTMIVGATGKGIIYASPTGPIPTASPGSRRPCTLCSSGGG